MVSENPRQPKPEKCSTSPDFSTKLQNRAAQPPSPGSRVQLLLGSLPEPPSAPPKSCPGLEEGFCEAVQESRSWGGHRPCTVLRSTDLSYSSSLLTHPARPVQSGRTGVAFPVLEIEVPGWAIQWRPPASKRQSPYSISSVAGCGSDHITRDDPSKAFQIFQGKESVPRQPHHCAPRHLRVSLFPGAPFWTVGQGPGCLVLLPGLHGPLAPGSPSCSARPRPAHHSLGSFLFSSCALSGVSVLHSVLLPLSWHFSCSCALGLCAEGTM